MTSEQRQEIRLALIRAGFIRIYSTYDGGFGIYDETWANDGHDVVILKWGPRDS